MILIFCLLLLICPFASERRKSANLHFKLIQAIKATPAAKMFFLYFKYLFIRIVIQCSLYLCVYLFCLIQRQKEPKFTFKTHSSNSIYTLAKLQFMVPWFDIKRPNGVKNVSVILCWHLCVQELKFECEIIFGNAFSGVLCVQRSCEKDSNLHKMIQSQLMES